MAKPRKIDRPVEKSISLPSSTTARVDLILFSQLEGKVPFGAWSKLVNGLLLEWLRKQGMEQEESSETKTTVEGEYY